MNRLSVFVVALVFSTGAFAQTAAPPAVAPSASERPVITPEQRARFQADRKACADELKAKELPRGERRPAMRTCMETRNPDLKPMFARGEARRAEMKQVRDACRTESNEKKLKGTERREAMKSCIIAKKPEMAKPIACSEEAKTKGLMRGTERRDFMRTCIRG
jgi:psiF repeat